jgi:Mrp family chromosome partitioning ATPase
MLDLLDTLKAEYPTSLLVFDLPPLLEADDMLAFSPHVDALLLVVSQGQTVRDRLVRAKELLEDATLLGVVLNKSDEAAASYY